LSKDPLSDLIGPILAGLGALAIGAIAFLNNKPTTSTSTYNQSPPPPKPCGCSAKK
jgi:hypothetical protein